MIFRLSHKVIQTNLRRAQPWNAELACRRFLPAQNKRLMERSGQPASDHPMAVFNAFQFSIFSLTGP
jgi:hypothetical protein